MRLSRPVSAHYRRCLEHPLLILGAVLLACVAGLYYVQAFRFDASAETLIAEGDPEFDYYQDVTERFGQSPFLVLTYTPRDGDLFSDTHLSRIERLETRLLGTPGVGAVDSLLDAPLLKSPPVPLLELADGYKTLRDPEVELDAAREELTNSPLFRELLVSADGRSTAMRIELLEGPALLNEARESLIAEIRALRDALPDDVELHLGGVPMVASDMIDYVKRDVSTFSALVVILIALSLFAFFRRLRWVLIPLGTTLVTLLLSAAVLRFLDQPVTVISSNFVPLLAIVTISFTVHLITRYRELRLGRDAESHCDLVHETMRSKLAPCIYTALTTAVAFGSLLTSNIVPVADFGWIMGIGIGLSLLVTYSFFASILVLLPKGGTASTLGWTPALTGQLSRFATLRPNAVLLLAAALGAGSVAGTGQLALGERFIDYFQSGTEIREGMIFIDEHLGGTIPLDVIVRFEPYEPNETGGQFDDFAMEEDDYPQRYWFTPHKLERLAKLQDHLDARPQIGKTISLVNLERIARDFNDGEPLDYLELTAVLSQVPEDVRKELIAPYASPETGEMRISARLHETGPEYSRTALIDDIRRAAQEEAGFAPDEVRVTGMAVLFTDMLTQLLRSQASTLLFVVLSMGAMFVLLLRSATLALVGLVPNLLAAAVILGLMGLFGVPLDMMTITIAAIVVGIGVDDAIHYLHRYKEERRAGADVETAIRITRTNIGSALYFTTITVVIGFSVLSFSNFVPTVHFGIFASIAMVLALMANLTLLPSLLMKLQRAV